MQIEFLGAAHEVTGSCHYVTFGDKHVLVDCGMEQGPDLYVNQEITVNDSNFDYMYLTNNKKAKTESKKTEDLMKNLGKFKLSAGFKNGISI